MFILWPMRCHGPWSRPNNLRAKNTQFFTFLSRYKVFITILPSLFPYFSLFNVRVAFLFLLSQLSLFDFVLVFVLCSCSGLAPPGGTWRNQWVPHLLGKGKVLKSEVKTDFFLYLSMSVFIHIFKKLFANCCIKIRVWNPDEKVKCNFICHDVTVDYRV